MSTNQKRLLKFILISFPIYFVLTLFINIVSWQTEIVTYFIFPILYKTFILKDNILNLIYVVLISMGILEWLSITGYFSNLTY